MRPSVLLAALVPALVERAGVATGLKISTSLQWIEHTPQPYAIRNFYKGSTTASLVSGGVASLGVDRSVDLAANAETQGLRNYASRRSLRLIYIICEVGYRIVADKRAGISTLADLKGKRVGTIPGTSAGYFVNKFLASAGLRDSDYRVVLGQRVHEDAVRLQHIPIHALEQAAGRLWCLGAGRRAGRRGSGCQCRRVPELLRLSRGLRPLRHPREAGQRGHAQGHCRLRQRPQPDPGRLPHQARDRLRHVAQAVGMDAKVVADVWVDHRWNGRWGPDLIDFLVEEDQYLARADRRTVTPRADLEKFLDTSVLDELGL